MNFSYAEREKYLVPSEIRKYAQLSASTGCISFAGGSPAPETFPVQELGEATDRVLSKYGTKVLGYGDTEGLDKLKEQIVLRLKEGGVDNIAIEQILITNGSQQGLDFCGKLFLDQDDVVICEDPSYLGAINAFRVYGCRFVSVAMDDDGMIMEDLEKALKENPRVRFIYTIPDFHNPTARRMSQIRRKKLLELAYQYNIPIIEDNPYGDLYYDGRYEWPIKHYDRENAVIYMGTCSKTFCPGLRIGWIVASQEVIDRFAIIKQSADIHTSLLAQYQLAEYMESFNWIDHVEEIRNIYKEKRNIMMNAIRTYFPENIKYVYPQGGLFTWIDLPDYLNAEDILMEALNNGVAFVTGSPFYVNGGHHNYFRLSFGMMTGEVIEEGIKRLGDTLKLFCE